MFNLQTARKSNMSTNHQHRDPRCPHPNNYATQAFSLVELLVVIAVIALLIAILLPSLGLAREQARRAKCAANLHAIIGAWNMYLDHDARGIFPLSVYRIDGVDRPTNIGFFYGGKQAPDEYTYLPMIYPRLLNTYVGLDPYDNRTAEIFHCPSDTGVEHPYDYFWHNAPSTYEHMGNSYPLSPIPVAGQIDPYSEDCNLYDPRRPLTLSLIDTSPSNFVLVGDQQHIYTPFNRRAVKAFWHDDRGTRNNIAFLDGHVAFTTMEYGVKRSHRYVYPYNYTPCEAEEEEEESEEQEEE